MSFLSRGAGATGLSMLGVRGATLAANSAFLAGAAAAVAFAKSIQLATQFSQELNVFKVTVGATADEMARVSAEARKLGRDVSLPGVSAQDAAEAMTELAKAGLSVQDSIDGARGVLQLATAAQLSNADATTLAASALNSIGLSGDQAVHVADLLANAANNAQGGIEDMGLALRQSAAVARQVGFSIEDTVALLTLLARNGLQGSDAGTALRTSLIRLINPTKEARNILADLNIQLRDQAGNLRPEVFAEFAAATANLTKAQQDARAAIVFGQDAIRAEAILGREGAKGLDAMRLSLDKQGTAAKVAAARMTGLAGETASLQNNLQDLGLTIGNIAVPVLGSFVRGLDDIVKGAGLAVDGVKAFNDRISGGGDFNAADAGLGKLTARLAEVSAERAKFTQDGHFIPPAFDQETADLTKRIVELAKAAQATGNSNAIDALFDAFKRSSPEVKAALKDNVITPLEAVELRATSVGRAFLKAAPKTMFVGLGAAARSGLEDAGAAVKRGVNDLSVTVHSEIEDAGRLAVVQASAAFSPVGDAIGFSMVEAARASIKRSQGQLAGLAEDMNKILAAGGTPQQQIANLRRQAAKEQKIIDAAGPNAAGTRLKARRDAQEALALINQQIAALEDQIAADQQKAASAAEDRRTKIQQARDAADQAFIDGISGKLAGIDNRILAAETKDALGQQIRLEKVKRDALIESISQVRQTVKNAKDRATELRSLTAELIRTNGEITSLTKEQRESEEKRLEDARNAITEKLAKQAQLAELRGDDQAELAAINRQIKDAQRRVAAAKKAKKGVLDEQIALQQLINQRKELIKKIRGDSDSGSDATGGTTLADFLRQNTDLFGQIAPNIGRAGIDPLSGFDFSKSLTATLSKLQAAARGTFGEVTPPGLQPPGGATTDRAIERLIDALDRNTNATQGNTTAGSPGLNRIATIAGQRGEAMARFWENRQSRVQTEDTHGI
jgi:TP901 family phage tail tape measure protein